jgi:hypothetical protein
MMRKPRVYISRWLLHAYVFLHNTIDKRVLHLKLSKALSSGYNNRQYNSNRYHFNHRTKVVLIINSILLFEFFRNQPRLVSVNYVICLMFDFVDPLTINQISALVCWYKMPSSNLLQCRKLLIMASFHLSSPNVSLRVCGSQVTARPLRSYRTVPSEKIFGFTILSWSHVLGQFTTRGT